jgi:hypothetical protein
VIKSNLPGPNGKPLPPMKFHLVVVLEKQHGRWLTQEIRPYAFAARPGAAQ